MNENVASMMRADGKRPAPKDKLDLLRKGVAELRDLELDNANKQEKITENNKRIWKMKTDELVALFDQAKVGGIRLEAEGNLPAYEVNVRPYYKANIGELDEEGQAKAFEWLIKNKHGDMIKSSYTVTFGMGEDKKRKKFEALLKKEKHQFSYSYGVPWNTLTAFVREQIETYKKSPPLKLLGAVADRMVQPVKAKKQSETSSTKGKK